MFTNKQQVIWIEIEDDQSAKRYGFPNDYMVIHKLEALLQRDYPQVYIKQHGRGTIISEPNTTESSYTSLLKDVPSHVDAIFDISMPTHPDVQSNIVRYSKELIDIVMQVEVGNNMQMLQVVKEEDPRLQPMPQSGPGLPKRKTSLADNFRNQLGKQESASTPLGSADLTSELRKQMEAKKGSTPTLTVLPERRAASSIADRPNAEEFNANDYIMKYCEELHEQNMEILDVIRAMAKTLAEMKFSLSAPKTAGITGKQLSEWYAEAAGKVGFDKAFDLLAEKLSGEETT